MTARIRKILRGDRSWALIQLRGQPVELWQDVLVAELRRARPRKRLVSTLRERIPQLAIESWLQEDTATMTSDHSSSSDLPKVGAPVGNQNAAKGEDGFDTVIRIRCRAADKAGWNRFARKEGVDLSEWIRARLNEAKK